MVRDRLEHFADLLIGYSDADYCRVNVSISENSLTRFANSQIHQNLEQEQFGIVLELVYGKKHGISSMNISDEEALKRMHDRLKTFVLSYPDDDTFVHYPEGGNFSNSSKWDDATGESGSSERAALVGTAINEAKKIDALVFGSLNVKKSFNIVANKYGNKGYNQNTYVDLQVIPAHGDNTTYLHQFSHELGGINILDSLAEPLSRLSLYKDHGEFPSGEQTVILEPNAAGDMMRFLNYMVFSGKAYNEKQSYISDKLGTQVTGSNIFFYDDHAHPLTMGAPFDPELTERKKLSLLEGGKAIEVAHDTKSASIAGTASTGHALFGHSMPICLNPVLQGGDVSRDEMIKGTENGLLITRFNYTNIVNRKKTMFTGMTRNGVYRVKDGKILGTANNMRFTVNIMETLKKVAALENKQHFIGGGWFGGIVVPSMKIDGFNFTGTTAF
ncbi:hypothetical protein KAR04_01170 [Candidatus Calescamantes bacterium]|nr:hypothetical protein [Candidatus Calescamantes bacterium]